MKIKRLLFACAFIYCVAVLNAQVVSPQTLPTQGGTLNSANAIMNYSFGQSFSGVLSGGNNILSVGFLQPDPIIKAGGIASGPYCAGSTVKIPFAIIGYFAVNNTFTAQLSDSSGSFASPVDIGVDTALGYDTVVAVIPPNTAAGAHYALRIISSSPVWQGDVPGLFTVQPSPTAHAGPNDTVAINTIAVLGDALPVGGTPPYAFQWTPTTWLDSPNVRQPTAAPFGTTTYTLQVTDSNGCTADSSVVVYFYKGDAITEITYTAENINYSTSGGQNYVDFDVFASDTPAGLLFSQGVIFIQYDTLIFGSSLVSSGKIVASMGLAVDSPFYNLTLADSMPNMLKISIVHTTNPSALSDLSIYQQLCHLRIDISAFNLTNVTAAYDSIAMAGLSKYERTLGGVEYPYDIVRVNGLIGAPEIDSCSNIIYYVDPSSITVSYSPNLMSFDIQAEQSQGGGTLNYGQGSIYLIYSSAPFGTNIASSVTVSSDFFSAADYYISVTNAGPFDLQIYIEPTGSNYSASLTDDSLVTILHVTMPFKAATCSNQSAGIVLDSVNTDMPYATEFAVPVGDSMQLFPYCNIATGDNVLDTDLCPPPTLDPTVSSSSSGGCIAAGSFYMVTITGDHFLNGSTGKPTVSFNDANYGENGGYTAQAYPQDILSATENQIVLLLPSRGISGQIPNQVATAGSGDFCVTNPGGLQSSAQNINIIYANQNDRGGDTVYPNYNHAQLVYLTQSYTNNAFGLDAALFNNHDAQFSVGQCMNDISCNLGVTFEEGIVAITDPASPSPGTNLIYMNSTDSFWIRNPAALMSTTVTSTHGCTISNDSQSVSNPTGPYMNDVVSASIEIRDDGTLSTNIMPGSTRWWFNGTTTPPPYNIYYDFATSLLHEFGHATLLYHSDDGGDSATRVMYYAVHPNLVRRSFSNDPDDIEGVYHNSHLAGAVGSVCSASPPEPEYWSEGCPDPGSTCGVNVIESTNTTYNPPDEPLQAFIYGNPSKENTVIHIDIYTFTQLTITLYDLLGNRILQKSVEDGEPFDITLPDAELAAGVYLINIRIFSNLPKTITLKLIKVN